MTAPSRPTSGRSWGADVSRDRESSPSGGALRQGRDQLVLGHLGATRDAGLAGALVELLLGQVGQAVAAGPLAAGLVAAVALGGAGRLPAPLLGLLAALAPPLHPGDALRGLG